MQIAPLKKINNLESYEFKKSYEKRKEVMP